MLGTDQERYQATATSLRQFLTFTTIACLFLLVGSNHVWPLFQELIVLLVVVAAGFAVEHRPGLLGGVVLGGSFAAIAIAPTLTGSVAWYSLAVGPVMAAGLLLHPLAAPIAGLIAIAVGIALPLGIRQAPYQAYLIAMVAGITYVGLTPTLRLLRAHSRRGLQAFDLVRQLRQRQGELNHTVKALDTAYRLLERSNYQLAMAQREAEELRDLRSRFATNLSHELRTPLNVILGFTNLISANPQLYGFANWPEGLMADLLQVQSNAAYLSDLANDVIDMARIDALMMPTRRESTPLAGVVAEAESTVASLATEKGIRLCTDVPADLPALRIDPLRIRQVLYNLLTNAIRYTDHGVVTVAAVQAQDEVVVSVADTGVGIPPEQLESVFDEYRQLGRARDGSAGGKGLGLAIAKRFVQLHGGRVWAESRVGEGSTFSFSLPLHEKTTAWLSQSRSAPPRGGTDKPRVAVVEEDGIATSYLTRQLEDYEFVQCASIADAVASVDERPVAVIANLPVDGDVDGALPDLSAIPEGVPLIGCTLPSTRWIRGHEHFHTVLSKPVTGEAVLQALRAVLPEGRGARVLVADDDRGFVQFVSRTLQASGDFRVTAAYNGADVLRKAERSHPDAILLDLRMPELNGFEVVERLRAMDSFRDVPVIAITAASPGEDNLDARGASFVLRMRGAQAQRALVSLVTAALESVRVSGGGSGAERPGTPPATPAS
ncbi:MAG: ATP-binding response regulator [Anaerolineae bacterium]